MLSFSLQPPNPQYLSAWAAAMDRLAKQSEHPISVMTIVDGRCRPPNEDSKTAIRNTIVQHSQCIGAFAYVIEGDGFAAAAVRSAVTLISLVARYPFPQKVFKEVDPASAWMLGRVPSESGQGVSVATLLARITSMRSSLQHFAATG
ncbi:MAG TPA: hypothetical protein VMG12_12260 [Polyangiaceae bacterium]|nr:hypothetical protein [Polyangiaceae bacterium]